MLLLWRRYQGRRAYAAHSSASSRHATSTFTGSGAYAAACTGGQPATALARKPVRRHALGRHDGGGHEDVHKASSCACPSKAFMSKTTREVGNACTHPCEDAGSRFAQAGHAQEDGSQRTVARQLLRRPALPESCLLRGIPAAPPNMKPYTCAAHNTLSSLLLTCALHACMLMCLTPPRQCSQTMRLSQVRRRTHDSKGLQEGQGIATLQGTPRRVRTGTPVWRSAR